jgi:hypothetical protein
MEFAFKKWYMKREKITDNKEFLNKLWALTDEERIAVWLAFKQGK